MTKKRQEKKYIHHVALYATIYKEILRYEGFSVCLCVCVWGWTCKQTVRAESVRGGNQTGFRIIKLHIAVMSS